MYSLFFILYFCIAHIMFIDLLILHGDASFKTNLIKSYLWIFVFINWIYHFLYDGLIKIYDRSTDLWEDFKALYYFVVITIILKSKGE
jgi:hypothetical protein